ncbi:MAG: hypothetical protein WA919_04945 [Coleofasciculaceae cyanobacterium]
MRIYNSIILLSLLTISVFAGSGLADSKQIGQLNSAENQKPLTMNKEDCYDGDEQSNNAGEARRECFKSRQITQFRVARRGSGRVSPSPDLLTV